MVEVLYRPVPGCRSHAAHGEANIDGRSCCKILYGNDELQVVVRPYLLDGVMSQSVAADDERSSVVGRRIDFLPLAVSGRSGGFVGRHPAAVDPAVAAVLLQRFVGKCPPSDRFEALGLLRNGDYHIFQRGIVGSDGQCAGPGLAGVFRSRQRYVGRYGAGRT